MTVETRILVLAPRGRDAEVAGELLHGHGFDCAICADLTALVRRLDEGAGAVLIAEEAVAGGDGSALMAWVEGQAKWSDLPFVLLANGHKAPRTLHAAAMMDRLGNVVLLERPLHADSLIGALRSALKARRRQYEVRAFADTLEQSVDERTRDLKEARESLEIALEAAELGSWDLDLTTNEARRTARHDEIFGYSSLLPHWSRDLFLSHVIAEEREVIATAFDKAGETGFLDIECRIDAADGARRWIAAKGRLHYDAQGRPVRMTGVVFDITARKEADERLAQVAKMDTIGQLTGGVAHDFNNLLTPIIGSLDLLRRHSAKDARAERLIDNATLAAERAATLTQRLLAFARRQTLEPRSVDTGALVDGMVELVRRSLGPTIEVVVDVPRNLAPARVDPNQLELALLNLAVNARDAMPSGGKLTFAASAIAVDKRNLLGLKPGHYVRILAVDTGTGMDKATLSRAVEPFFSTKGVGKGTGLGLSMAHGLAAQSGGALHVNSAPSKGTTIELWLPASDDPSDLIDRGERRLEIAPGSATVLLADDEELVRGMTAELLRDLGYTVVEAGSGAQVLKAIRNGIEVDAVITDYLMPGMTGAALIQELRAMGSRLPVLVITGYANAGDDLPAEVSRLSKPYRQVDLAARVKELVSLSPNREPRARLRAVD